MENNKYSVQYALNGIEGINLCKSFVPDLIILDIMLPGLNGDDVLQKLRKFTNAPVIVVSAKTMVQTKIELLKIGQMTTWQNHLICMSFLHVLRQI